MKTINTQYRVNDGEVNKYLSVLNIKTIGTILAQTKLKSLENFKDSYCELEDMYNNYDTCDEMNNENFTDTNSIIVHALYDYRYIHSYISVNLFIY